jgi:transposase InsO family protein
LPSDQKYDFILLVLDWFSGYTYLFQVFKNIDAKQTTQILLDRIFSVHGYPLSIVSDRDSQFTLHFWQQLMKNLQIELKMTTSYHH